jgi:zinc D-Ala-D-Ala carboxypeptidase
MKINYIFALLILTPAALYCADVSFGHFRCQEIARSELNKVGAYPGGKPIMLEKRAAQELSGLIESARAKGIRLRVISGFRSIEYQKGVYARAVKRYKTPAKAARHVAPPGYSQHHTGRAVDLGDADHPATDLEVSFAGTTAFAWLAMHAVEFGYNLSFPKNNPQGVSYEPWHWYYQE